jgi:membrane protease YdiL (CAAX protease family)
VLLLYLFSAAIPEEVHFRGVLLTRLMRLWGPSWAIVASSLLFGAYHAVANVTYFNGAPVPVALALGVVVEGTIGLSFAIVFLRTRNLVAVVALHTVLDTFNFTLLPHVQRFFM